MKASVSKRRLKDILQSTGDSEPEQALIRVVVGLLLVIIFCIPWQADATFSDVLISTVDLVVLSYFILGVGVFLSILSKARPSPIRRIIGIFIDLVPLSILMFSAAEETVFLIVFYLWVILGNGFRYGVTYLYISLAVGLVGFIGAIVWGEYWQAHRSISLSLLLLMTLIPLYSVFLINKLHSAIAMAESANKAKTRFLANMSHELRTPLNGVIGIGDLLADTQLNNQQRELVGVMQGSAKTLLKLIEKVLDISKIEAGKTLIRKEEFDLHELINSVTSIQVPIAVAKSLRLACTIDSNVPFLLKGDAQHIKQVLINLIGNAIKFTDSGMISLHVSVSEKSHDDKVVVHFSVKDTGIGIARSDLDSVFDDFTQVGGSVRHSAAGTGLGTTISKELVELMDGEIGADSELNKGSTFWFDLPFDVVQQQAETMSVNRVLSMLKQNKTAIVMPILTDWEIVTESIQTPDEALLALNKAKQTHQPYNVMLVDRECIEIAGMTPAEFAKSLESEHLSEGVSLVLVDTSGDYVNVKDVDNYYISVIDNIADKRIMFNAIHAAQSVHLHDDNVISIADYYASQQGAQSLNVLVAEDNAVNQQVIEGILTRAGHSVVLANNGEEALDILETDLATFDLLIVDKNMPLRSGDEVVKTLRFMDTRKSIPIIMLTADATTEAKLDSDRLEIDAFLTKPLDSRKLLEKIAIISQGISTSTEHSRKENSPTHTTVHTLNELVTSDADSNDEKWCDHAVLQELFLLAKDNDFMQRLINGFIEDGEKHIARIHQARNDDYLVLRESLHALKGSASEFGAHKLVDLCRKGEDFKPYDMGTDTIFEFVRNIESVYQNTVKALRSQLDTYYPEEEGNSTHTSH